MNKTTSSGEERPTVQNYWVADGLQIGGTYTALQKQGIPMCSQPAGEYNLLGSDGHEWHVKGDGLMWVARRGRTAEEEEVWQDWLNASQLLSWFSADRMRLCNLIAVELMSVADELNGPRSREQRRGLRKKLNILGTAQWTLTKRAKVDMRQVRSELASVGVLLPAAGEH